MTNKKEKKKQRGNIVNRHPSPCGSRELVAVPCFLDFSYSSSSSSSLVLLLGTLLLLLLCLGLPLLLLLLLGLLTIRCTSFSRHRVLDDRVTDLRDHRDIAFESEHSTEKNLEDLVDIDRV